MVSDALEGEIARVAALSFPDRGGVVPAAFDFGAAHDARGRQRVCVFLTGHVERNKWKPQFFRNESSVSIETAPKERIHIGERILYIGLNSC